MSSPDMPRGSNLKKKANGSSPSLSNHFSSSKSNKDDESYFDKNKMLQNKSKPEKPKSKDDDRLNKVVQRTEDRKKSQKTETQIRKENEALKSQLAYMRKRVNMSSMGGTLSALDPRHETNQIKKGTLQNIENQEKVKIIQDYMEYIKQLKAEIKSYQEKQKKINKFETQKNELEKQLEETGQLKNHLMALIERNQGKEEVAQDQSTKIQLLKQENTGYQDNIKQLRAKVEYLTRENQRLNNNQYVKKENEQSLDALRAKNRVLERTIDFMKQQEEGKILTTNGEISSLKQQLLGLDEENNRLMVQVDELHDKIQEVKEEGRNDTMILDLKRALQQVEDENDGLKGLLEDKEDDSLRLEKLEQYLDQMQKQAQMLQHEVEKRDQIIKSLKEDHQKSILEFNGQNHANVSALRDMEPIKNQLAQLHNQLKQKDEDVKLRDQRIGQLIRQVQLRNEVQPEDVVSRDRISNPTTQDARKTVTHQNANIVSKQTDEQNKELKGTLVLARVEIERLSDKVSHQQRQISFKEDDIRSLKDKVSLYNSKMKRSMAASSTQNNLVVQEAQDKFQESEKKYVQVRDQMEQILKDKDQELNSLRKQHAEKLNELSIEIDKNKTLLQNTPSKFSGVAPKEPQNRTPSPSKSNEEIKILKKNVEQLQKQLQNHKDSKRDISEKEDDLKKREYALNKKEKDLKARLMRSNHQSSNKRDSKEGLKNSYQYDKRVDQESGVLDSFENDPQMKQVQSDLWKQDSIDEDQSNQKVPQNDRPGLNSKIMGSNNKQEDSKEPDMFKDLNKMQESAFKKQKMLSFGPQLSKDKRQSPNSHANNEGRRPDSIKETGNKERDFRVTKQSFGNTPQDIRNVHDEQKESSRQNHPLQYKQPPSDPDSPEPSGDESPMNQRDSKDSEFKNPRLISKNQPQRYYVSGNKPSGRQFRTNNHPQNNHIPRNSIFQDEGYQNRSSYPERQYQGQRYPNSPEIIRSPFDDSSYIIGKTLDDAQGHGIPFNEDNPQCPCCNKDADKNIKIVQQQSPQHDQVHHQYIPQSERRDRYPQHQHAPVQRQQQSQQSPFKENQIPDGIRSGNIIVKKSPSFYKSKPKEYQPLISQNSYQQQPSTAKQDRSLENDSYHPLMQNEDSVLKLHRDSRSGDLVAAPGSPYKIEKVYTGDEDGVLLLKRDSKSGDLTAAPGSPYKVEKVLSHEFSNQKQSQQRQSPTQNSKEVFFDPYHVSQPTNFNFYSQLNKDDDLEGHYLPTISNRFPEFQPSKFQEFINGK